MTTSDRDIGRVFVWIWLPDATAPVVAGRLAPAGDRLLFNYGRSYLARPDAIAIYAPELPLRPGLLPLPPGLRVPSAIRDAAPDGWGRRVILNRLFGRRARGADPADLDERTYLLESGSDRIGALDFQHSATVYEPRSGPAASLGELLSAAERVEAGLPLSPDLEVALLHGTSVGGARPKAMIEEDGRRHIAKFASRDDAYPVVRAEFAAMRLARAVGIDAAPVRLVRAAGKDVLLVERFDRTWTEGGWRRRGMVSALTLLGLDEMMARYASYQDLAEIVRHRFAEPRATLRELFARMLFNVLCGNTDDHARNHSAFWDGRGLALTPAYDVAPQLRAGGEATQAMLITGGDRTSRVATCLAGAAAFLLSPAEAAEMVRRQVTTIRDHWPTIAGEAGLGPVDRNLLWGRALLNPFAFEGLPPEFADLAPQ
jgi:serine/threonine-protein kinase HipA